jgi:hypothetical protein
MNEKGPVRVDKMGREQVEIGLASGRIKEQGQESTKRSKIENKEMDRLYLLALQGRTKPTSS